jgi:hypothetical protein
LATFAIIVALCGIVLSYANRHYLWTTLTRSNLRWFVLAVLTHAVLLAWSGTGFISPNLFWYYVPELFLIIFGLSLLYQGTTHNIAHFSRIVAIVPALVLCGSSFLYKIDQDIASYAPYRKAITIARELTPPTAVIGSWDAGYNAYWLRPRTVINLDGMTNNREYIEQIIKPGYFSKYCTDQHIEYLFNMVLDTESERTNISNHFFCSPSIVRGCYDILDTIPFKRQGLVIYLLRYKC